MQHARLRVNSSPPGARAGLCTPPAHSGARHSGPELPGCVLDLVTLTFLKINSGCLRTTCEFFLFPAVTV